MAKYITKIRTEEGDLQIDYNALANLPASVTDVTNTVISPNADYAEVGEWADGNPDDEDRLGYFIAVAEVGDNTIKIRKATSEDDVRGVTVYNPAFSGNAAAYKYGADGELLQQYNYVGIMGIVSVIDNGRCSVNGRCMPGDDGTAVPSTNNMGYAVLERVDDTHVLIAVEPGADMIQRVKDDVEEIKGQIEELGNTNITVDAELSPTSENPVQNKVITQVVQEANDVMQQLGGAMDALSKCVPPTVTESDNGKVLTVVGGAWQAADAPSGGGSITVDAELSETSENPVQNKVITKVVQEANVAMMEIGGAIEIMAAHLTPAVSAEDNGKFLQVVGGTWQAVSLTDVSVEGA